MEPRFLLLSDVATELKVLGEGHAGLQLLQVDQRAAKARARADGGDQVDDAAVVCQVGRTRSFDKQVGEAVMDGQLQWHRASLSVAHAVRRMA